MSDFNPKDICIFCHTHRNDVKPKCSYDAAHEFPEFKVKQVAKVDKSLCLICRLHKRNPSSATSECKHQYEK